MTTRTLHPLAEDYLDRLERAAEHLPRERRRELLADIEAHLAEALPPDATEAQVLTVLDRLGAPEEIVEAELPTPVAARDPRGLQEWAAIILLPLGGFIFGVGWIAGLILLWSSRAWTTRDKLIGTLFWPGGVATSFMVGSAWMLSASCVTGPGHPTECSDEGLSSWLGPVTMIAVFVVPVLTAVYLARRAGRST